MVEFYNNNYCIDPNTTDKNAIDYHNEYLKFAENVKGVKVA